VFPLKRFLPASVFLLLVFFFAIGLKLDPREIPSPLIGKKAPDFVLPTLMNQAERFDSRQMLGKPWILNVWASWCRECRKEHGFLMELAKTQGLQLIGLDYKDEDQEARLILNMAGNPYHTVVADRSGLVGIDYGVYGVPETYLIDSNGMIQYKKIGPLSRQDIVDHILPLMPINP
jgi:cytochrome c biogenesis protein CcmG, thiol:disulfide interchange protein DsbE